MTRLATDMRNSAKARRSGHRIWFVLTLILLAFNYTIIAENVGNSESPGPVPDSPSYLAQALEIADGNFLTIPWVGEVGQSDMPDGGMYPSRFGVGYSTILAVAPLLMGGTAQSVMVANSVVVMLLITLSALVARRISGWPAAALVLVFWGLSPFPSSMSRIVMSDALIATVALGSFWLVIAIGSRLEGQKSTTGLSIGLGGLLGLATLLHLRLGMVAAAAIVAIRSRKSLFLVVLAAVPGVLLLLSYQAWAYGSPFMSGYDYWLPDVSLFRLDSVTEWDAFGDGPWLVADRLDGTLMTWTCPCTYPGSGVMHHTPPWITGVAVLTGAYWIYLPPIAVFWGIGWLWTNRRARGAQFVVILALLNVLIFLFSLGQAVRYLAPTGTLLIVVSAAGLVSFGRWILDRPWLRPDVRRTENVQREPERSA